MVGESGCGKSTLGKALLRMLPPQAVITGQMIFEGEDICSYSPITDEQFPRPESQHDLSGPDDLAQSGAARR